MTSPPAIILAGGRATRMGGGDKGLRASHWGHSSNIRVEIVCDTSLAERVLARLREKYYAHYAIVMWVVDVEVLRPDKFR